MLHIVVHVAQAYQYFAVVIFIYFELDPIYLVQKHIFPIILNYLSYYSTLFTKLVVPPNSNPDFKLSDILWFLARLLQIIPCAQVCLALSWTVILFTVIAHLALQCIESMDTGCHNILLRNRYHVDQHICGYAALRIIVLMATVEIGAVISLFMTIGMIMCIILNYVTIKLYALLPPMIYIICAVLAILLPGVILVMLPMIVDIHENGRRVVDKWKDLLSRRDDKKYLVRRVRSIKLLCVHAELFGFKVFKCQKSTKRIYYFAIVNYTWTALLSVDSSRFVYVLQ